MSDIKTGVELIAEERERQKIKEGYDSKHDSIHDARELARAANSYVGHYIARQWLLQGTPDDVRRYSNEQPPEEWPWDEVSWKPKSRIRDLARAGALIAAEIDRLQRKHIADAVFKPLD